uniref:Uncharacterized protein n=1 Tax=Cacopsylla melanoneura TaxID=428564 RepID=A0A8D8X078_9HEMI
MRMDRNTQSFNHHLVKDLIKQEGISPKKYNIYEIIIIPYICGSVLMNAELNYLLFCIEQKITTSLKVRNHENLNFGMVLFCLMTSLIYIFNIMVVQILPVRKSYWGSKLLQL